MSKHKVIVLNTGQEEILTMQQGEHLFGYKKWLEMREGSLLPLIDVEPVDETPAEYFNKGLRLSDGKNAHVLPWTTQE